MQLLFDCYTRKEPLAVAEESSFVSGKHFPWGLFGRGGIPLTIVLIVVSWLAQVADAQLQPASFAYVLQANTSGRTKSAAVEWVASCGRDWIVLDAVFSDDAPWNRADLEVIRSEQPSRKVIAYISVGEAEDYRPYWRKEWGNQGQLTAAAPSWLGEENPNWQGNYRVHFWHTEWQQIILRAVDDAMTRGFDGVYLDIVDGFENFEQDGNEYIDDRLNPQTKQSFRRDMVEWVKTIAARARTNNPAALVIPQNGSQLLQHADYLPAISAIGIEDLFTEGDKRQPRSHTSEVLGHLRKMTAAEKPVLVIEYPKRAELQTQSKKLATTHGFTWLITDRQLKTLGSSGR